MGSQRNGDLIFASIMTVGAKLAPGDLDRVRKGSWKRAIGISVVAWNVLSGDGSLIGVVLPRGIVAGVEPVQRNGKAAAALTGGLAHDVSIVLGVGRHLGLQPRTRPLRSPRAAGWRRSDFATLPYRLWELPPRLRAFPCRP